MKRQGPGAGEAASALVPAQRAARACTSFWVTPKTPAAGSADPPGGSRPARQAHRHAARVAGSLRLAPGRGRVYYALRLRRRPVDQHRQRAGPFNRLDRSRRLGCGRSRRTCNRSSRPRSAMAARRSHCPVVNRSSAALWYRPLNPLLVWLPLLRRCGLPAPETVVTDDPDTAYAFCGRLESAGVPGAVCTSLTPRCCLARRPHRLERPRGGAGAHARLLHRAAQPAPRASWAAEVILDSPPNR